MKNIDRRNFLSSSLALSAVGFSSNAIANSNSLLRVLNDRPLNAETPVHLLDPEVTPTELLFVRNNGHIPSIAYQSSVPDWRLNIDGELDKNHSFSLEELQSKFRSYKFKLVLECGGNGRAGFFPPTKGNQWTYGAVGCPEWEGVRLRDVLQSLGVKKSAVYIGYYGHDVHLSGDPEKEVISRGVPIAKALDPMTLIAFKMNGKPLTPEHGYPARLVCPGYPASASGKWLKRIWVRNKVHDGTKMLGESYRVPKSPVKPGADVPASEMRIIEAMPVKSIITFPKSGGSIKLAQAKEMSIRGFAWSGSGSIRRVDITTDFGKSWQKATLHRPANTFAWQRFAAKLVLPKGYTEIWARATDSAGKMQPMVVPGWNPKGYLNNAMPRISVQVV